MSYKKNGQRAVVRLSDLAGVPFVDGHPDYEEYKAWLSEGNAPLDEFQDESPEMAKARIWEAIKAERDRRKSSGVKVGDYYFHSDADSRIQQMGLVMMGASMPTGMMWKTMSGAFVEMTPSLAMQIFNATAAYDNALFQVAETHKAKMSASADPASYDFSTGWPSTYGG